MKTLIKKTPNSGREINITLSFEELQPSIDEAKKELAKNLKLEGFREGKVPPEIAEKKLDKETILQKAIEIGIKKAYEQAIKEKNLEVIGQPEIKILNSGWEKPLEVKIQVWVLPEVKLPDYKKIASQVERKKIEVKDSEVEETIKWIQKSRAKFSAKLSPCEKGDLVVLSYSSPEFEGGKEKKDQFIIGEGYLIPGFEEAILGMSTGEEKEVTVSLPPNHVFQELAGKTIPFKIKIENVQKIELPEVNDEWAKSLGNFKNLAELKNSIKEGIEKEKEEIESQRVQGEILEKISQQSETEIPQVLIDIETDNMINDMKQRIPQMLAISFEDYLKKANLTEDKLRESLLPEIKNKIKKYLVLQEIKKLEKIEATKEEIEEEANKFLAQFRTPEEAEKVIDPETLINYTKERIENQKTLKFLEKLT